MVLLKDAHIHDFNATLPFPTPITPYFAQSFVHESLLHHHQIPMFRVLSAAEYIALFLSDRLHMKLANGWSAPPPDWPPISQHSSNLSQFIDMNHLALGQVMRADELLKSRG